MNNNIFSKYANTRGYFKKHFVELNRNFPLKFSYGIYFYEEENCKKIFISTNINIQYRLLH